MILAMGPVSETTVEVTSKLREELASSFDVAGVGIDRTTPPSAIGQHVARYRPSALVLLDNSAVDVYRRYQQEVPDGSQFPPAVVLMASFVEEQVARLRNATGISYEVPAVSVLTSLRTALSVKVRRVGVVHRAALKGFVTKHATLAAREDIHLVPVEISDAPTTSSVRVALRRLFEEEKVDAVWVLNDNALLSPQMLTDAWLPAARSSSAPMVVGVAPFVDPRLRFGAFAVVPDHAGLAVQAATLLLELQDSNWSTSRVPVEMPVSVKTMVDARMARERFRLKADALQEIDMIVE